MRTRTASAFFLHPIAVLRLVAAASLFAIGAVHLQLYLGEDYSVLPTIGTLFLLNFIAGTMLGLYFLVPARARVSSVRLLSDTVVALSGLGVAVGGAVALLVSEHTVLFGFMEHGYRFAVVFALAAEGTAIVALGTFLALSFRSSGQALGRSKRGGSRKATPVTES